MNKFYLTSILMLALANVIHANIPGRTDDSFPIVGNPKTLVILVDFDGTPFNVEDAYGYFHGILKQDDFTGYFSKGSCQQYFRENSCGIFEPEFDVYGPVTLPKKASYYGANINNIYDKFAHEMVIDACQKFDDEIDFKNYDTNGDGIIDNVFIVYAGYGEASGGGADTVWPHAAYISKKMDTSIILDGVRLDRYCCVNEMEKDYPTGIGTFCHEFLHVLGLPDLYTTDQSNRYTLGKWDVMDHGSVNGNHRRPCNISAYERSVLGWLQPEELVAEKDYTLPPLDDNKAYIIRTDSPSEYFFLENRQPQNWDKSLSGKGLLIWHIDYQEDKWADNIVNNNPEHMCVDIVRADGMASDGSESGDTFPGTSFIKEISQTTTPKFSTWEGKNLGISIKNISENPDKTVSFRVESDQSSVSEIFDGKISIESRTISSSIPFTLIDITGRIIVSNVYDTELSAPGIYILSTTDITKKIIIK